MALSTQLHGRTGSRKRRSMLRARASHSGKRLTFWSKKVGRKSRMTTSDSWRTHGRRPPGFVQPVLHLGAHACAVQPAAGEDFSLATP